MPLACLGLQNRQYVTSDTSKKKLLARLTDYNATHAIEKAYLQFDKPYYAIGDTIYFKAYITIGAENKLSALSGVLYADLIDPQNKIIRTLKLQIVAGTAIGDITLTDSLKAGNYCIRAYTNWMRNVGQEFFFKKILPVAGTNTKRIIETAGLPKKNKSQQKEINKTDLQFLPEGGGLITGNYSKMAFKATGGDGLGKDVKGVVTDENGENIVEFESGHAGMGNFTFVPKEGKTYKATVTYSDGSSTTIPLPKARNEGYTLSVNTTNHDTIRIRTAAGANSSTQKLRLVAQAHGKVYYAVENNADNKYFSVAIPKSKFPTGIVQFTLLSPIGEPLNERLVFIENHNETAINLKTDKQTYFSRQKVNIQINAKNKDQKPAIGSYSVSVTDEGSVPIDTSAETTILTSLLLASDLKGNIEQPNYYFNHPTETTKIDLDNLLLTQGYRHFTWKQIADTTQPEYQPETGITIAGTVMRNNKGVPGAQVKLFSKAGGMFMMDTVTNASGKFFFKDLVFADSTKFLIQSRVKKGQDDIVLKLDTNYMPGLTSIAKIIPDTTKLNAAALANYTSKAQLFYNEQKKYGINQHPIILDEVKIDAKKELLVPHSQNLNGSGNADQVLTASDMDKLICAGPIIYCIQGLIHEVKFGKSGASSLRGMGGAMAIIIDGNFVEYDDFYHMQPSDIEGIEVALGPHYGAIYGSRAAGGAIIITTRMAKKQNQYYRYAPGVVTYMPKGFYKAREFYSPQYDNPHTNQKMADLRSTIYWNPNIITDKDGKASFSYFNADGKGTYRVVIEGIDADGNLGRQVLRYKVE